ncbi:Zinc finger, SWIM-type [Phytophthora cactorum]|nr:Zinc finger, SWIM-type [Phytophthora cactorum]
MLRKAREQPRMERLGQPMIGWTVNLSTQTCGCRAFYKFGACVHLLASLKHANRKIAGWPGTERRFVDRRVKRSKPSTGAQRGRPARVSHALSVD